MHHPFLDITKRISERPTWWMEGVPRYCEYHQNGLYSAKLNLLVRVACGNCSCIFDTSFVTNKNIENGLIDSETGEIISEIWSAPPFHLGSDGFNCPGNYSSAELIAALQAWERGRDLTRRLDLEGELPDCPPGFRSLPELT